MKHLRLFDLDLSIVKRTAFAPALNSFAQLEKLVIVRFIHSDAEADPRIEFELKLPVLSNIHVESLDGIRKLTLDTPRLVEIKNFDCAFMRLEIVHHESVERVITNRPDQISVKQLKSLKCLYNSGYLEIDNTLLSNLEQLREIHLSNRNKITQIFNQKRQYGRTSLKIYLCGCLLNGPDDPAMRSLADYFSGETFVYLAGNPSRLADEIPIYRSPDYATIELVALIPGVNVLNVLNRLTDCDFINVNSTVWNVQRFLDFLKSFDQIVGLQFLGDQMQDLFD